VLYAGHPEAGLKANLGVATSRATTDYMLTIKSYFKQLFLSGNWTYSSPQWNATRNAYFKTKLRV
jgi:hypothetical protein